MPAAKTTNKRRHGFTPFRPPTGPPPGTFDPWISQGARASNTGLQDLVQQYGYDPVTGAPTGTDSTRQLHDYLLGQGRINQQSGYTLADLLTNHTRGQQDYGTATANVNRQYANLASSQAQAANAAGVLGASGWNAQAADKRAVNHALEQAPLDATAQRQAQDYGTAVDRTNTGTSQQLGDLGLNYGRQTENNQIMLNQATRDNSFAQQDANESAWYQSRYAGYVPPTAPPNEHHLGNVTWRTLGGGRTVSADGTVRSSSQLDQLLRRRGFRH